MSLPEVLPILTSERFTFELAPVTREVEGVEVHGYDWLPVRQIGDRLTAVVSAIGYIEMRGIRAITDKDARIDRFVELARIEVFHKRENKGGVSAIPEEHIYSLITVLTRLSSTGADPFGVAPAASQP